MRVLAIKSTISCHRDHGSSTLSFVARSDRESAYPTLWQLEALRVAAHADSWDEVTAALGVDSKHQVLRTVARLEEKLGIQRGLLLDRDNRPHVLEPFQTLVDEAEAILTGWEAMQHRARETERSYFVRFDAYWSHIELIAGDLLSTFRPSSRVSVRIELAPRFGSRREHGGAGMLADLVPPNPRLDVAVAPDDEPEDPAGLTSRHAYRWALVAALDHNHPLQAEVEDGVLDVSHLARYPVVASPKAHRTRDLLDIYQSSFRSFDVRATSPEPAALLAMGHGTRLVPIIASDSTLPLGPWLGTRAVKPTVTVELPTWWPALGFGGGVLGGAYRVYWRTEDKPRGLLAVVTEFAAQLAERSKAVDVRCQRWWERLPSSIRN